MSQAIQLVAVTRENHQSQSWKAPANHRFAMNAATAALVASEVGKAAAAMPLALQKLDSGWILVGMMGVQPNQNLMVGLDGRWLGQYMPAAFRAYPFRMATPKEGKEPILCVHEDSGLIGPRDQGQPFFDEEGKLSKELSMVVKLMGLLERERQGTQAAVLALAAADVLKPMDLQVRLPDGQTQPGLPGLHQVDEAKLRALDAVRFEALRHNGALALAYAQMLSMHQFERLQQLSQQRMADVAAASGAAPGSGLQTDGVIRFS